MNSLNENTQRIIEEHTNSVYKIWNSQNFTKKPANKKTRNQKKIKWTKVWWRKGHEHFYVWTLKLNCLWEDWLGMNNTKTWILNRILPEYLRYINTFQCTVYVKRVIPEIITSNDIDP